MGKREYDRAYQRQHTKVVQIRLHKENDADIIDDIIAEAKRDGVSVSSRLKYLIRIGYARFKEEACTGNCDNCPRGVEFCDGPADCLFADHPIDPPKWHGFPGCADDCDNCPDGFICDHYRAIDKFII